MKCQKVKDQLATTSGIKSIMTTEKLDENQIEHFWNPDYVDEILEFL